MKVREIMSSHVVRIPDNASLVKAAQMMQSADVGALPVQKSNQTVGLITDRDIVVRAISATGSMACGSPGRGCFRRQVSGLIRAGTLLSKL